MRPASSAPLGLRVGAQAGSPGGSASAASGSRLCWQARQCLCQACIEMPPSRAGGHQQSMLASSATEAAKSSKEPLAAGLGLKGCSAAPSLVYPCKHTLRIQQPLTAYCLFARQSLGTDSPCSQGCLQNLQVFRSQLVPFKHSQPSAEWLPRYRLLH